MKNIYTRLSLGLLFLLYTLFVKAQNTANYSFATTTTGSLTDMSSGTTQLIAVDQDDFASSVTNIGFDFFFNGVRQTQFSVNSNGSLRFGATIISNTLYDPLGQAGQSLLTAYGANQRTHAGDGKVHYKITGAAPNRILIVEWLNIQANFSAGGTANLTYQVRLYETTGVIEYVYGPMTMSVAGAADVNSSSPQIGFSSNNAIGTVGSLTAAQSGTPAPTYNSASATPANNLYTAGSIPVLTSIADGARRTFSFTPPVPADPTALSFTAISLIAMTLNWTDNATNETAYAIYRSTDGINYSYVNQVAANSVNSVQTGLFAGTTYYWQVFAVSEGGLSLALSGTQTTIAAGNITSNGTGGGLWSNPATWVGNIVPTGNDMVTIQDGDIVVIDMDASAYSLSIGEGISGTLEFEPTTARTLTAVTDVIINTGGIFQSSLAGTQTGHNLSLDGNLVNNGTLDFSTNADGAGAIITFTGSTTTSFSGTGLVTDIRQLTINKGTSNAGILELLVTNFSVRGVITDAVVGGFLILTNGTFKISGTFTYTGRVFGTAAYTILATTGVWLNNPNFTIAAQNGNVVNNGVMRITSGTWNVGTTNAATLTGAAAASWLIEGGTLNVSGRLNPATAVTYTQSDGVVNVAVVGNTGSGTANGSFTLPAAASFNMTGGTINLVQASTGATPIDYINNATIVAVAGTLRAGTAATATNFNFRIRGTLPNFIIDNTTNNKTATAAAQINLRGIVVINPGATMVINGQICLIQGGSFTNNGTLTGTVAGTRFYFLGGFGPTTYSGTGVVTAPLTSWEIDNPDNVTIDPAASQVTVLRYNNFRGGLINSNKLTLGNGGATTAIVQLGVAGVSATINGFDVPPVYNPGTGGINLLYAPELTGRTMGNEVPPSRTLNLLNITNPNTITIAGGDITTNTLTMSAGNINTGTNTLTVGTSVATPGTFTYTNGTIIGKFRRWITAATGNRDFPVGIATAKRNASINFTTAPATGGTLTAEWVATPGGANGMPLTEGAITLHNTSHDGFWRVVAGDGLSGGNYTGTFTATTITGVNDHTQLVLVKRADGSSPWTLDGTHVTTIGSNAIPVLSRTNMAGFSDFAVAGGFPLNPLPVTLLSFTAQRDVNVNLIKWSTSQEINSHHFVLERSSDGRNYTAITQVPAAGNSNDTRYYSFTDNNPGIGINYYRLQMVDIDNSSKYSAIRIVRNEGIADVAVYPNPVKDVLQVSITADKAGKGNMIITNMNGHAIYKKPINVGKGINNFYVDMNPFAGGAYLINIEVSDDRVVKKFNKL